MDSTKADAPSAFDEAESDDPGATRATAVARERRQLRRMLAREVAWLDRKVAEVEREDEGARESLEELPSAERECDPRAARAWRARLKQDLDALERTPVRGWPALRDKIERDLEHGTPPSVPRSYDRAVAI